MLGKTISHYKILDKLGEGGMGVVYKAEDTRLKRIVALKFLPSSFMASEAEKTRFVHEAQAAAALNHPNICTIYEIDEVDGQAFIAMEFVEGQSLKVQIDSGPLKLDEALNIAIQIAQGLAKAHEHGITHRDIKPANVIITKDGVAKILDFGLAKLAGQPRLTKTGSTLGTMAYMSPEQARGEEVDHRTDIWALGVVIYEMLTGQLPFKGEYEHAVMHSILYEQPEPVTKLRSDISPEWAEIVEKALQKDRQNRWQSVSEMLNDLQFAGQGQAANVAIRKQKPVLRTASKKKTKHTRLSSSLGIIAGVMAIALYFIFFSSSDSDTNLPPMRTIRITSFPGQEYHPALSPDGKSIAFSWNGPQQDNFDIYVKLVDVGTPVRLTTNPLKENRPEWSPDGRYIAFVRETGVPKETPKNELYIIPALGGRERKIAEYYPPHLEEPGICWSLDGKSVFFTDWSNEMRAFTLSRVSVETAEREQVTASTVLGLTGDTEPTVSPDGKSLAFIRRIMSDDDLYRLSFKDKGIQRLTFDQGEIEELAWTQDSRSIIFSANRDGSLALWKIPASGGTPEKIAGGISASDPSIAFSGNRLAYTEATTNSNIWKIDLRNTKKQALLISSSTLTNRGPDISPDGEKIVFTSNRTGNYEVWISDSDGKNQTQLTTLNSAAASWVARWSPNGQLIVFDLAGSTQDGIYIIQASGGKSQKIAEDGFVPNWSATGEWIYYYHHPQKPQIYKVSRDGKTSIQLTRKGGIVPRAPRQGDDIYYMKAWEKSDIWRIPSVGGEEQPILEGMAEIDLFSWAVAQNGIYFVNRNGGSPVLEFFDFNTKRVKRLASLTGAFLWGGLALSPDETWLLYSKTESIQSDIILIEKFR